MKTQNKTIDVFFTANDAYAKYLCVTLISILKNAKENECYNFYILTSGMSAKNKNKLSNIKTNIEYHIEFINVEAKLFNNVADSSQKHRIPKETNYRFLTSSIKPELDKCIFLDADLIVVDSLGELIDENLDDNYALAAYDFTKNVGTWHEDMNLPNGFQYRNTGVTVFNLKKWREDNIENKLFDVAEKYGTKLRFPDQDSLNIALAPKIKRLNDSWNLLPTSSFFDIQEYDKPRIIHWAGSFKPWHYLNVKYSGEYWKYAFKSSYFAELVFGFILSATKDFRDKIRKTLLLLNYNF